MFVVIKGGGGLNVRIGCGVSPGVWNMCGKCVKIGDACVREVQMNTIEYYRKEYFGY